MNSGIQNMLHREQKFMHLIPRTYGMSYDDDDDDQKCLFMSNLHISTSSTGG